MAVELKPVLVKSIYTLSLFLACCLPSAALIACTRKRSPLRFLWTAGLGLIAYQFCLASSTLTTSLVLNSVAIGQGMIGILQCFNLLLLTGIEEDDLLRTAVYEPSTGFLAKLICTFGLLINYRGINTPWQAKNVPEFPRFYIKRGSQLRPARGWYVLRQTCIIAWQYLLLDIIYISSLDVSAEDNTRLFGPGTEFLYWNATPEQWISRFFVGVFVWFLPARVVIDIASRILVLPFIASGILRTDSCPPTFDRISNAYTIRRFWK